MDKDGDKIITNHVCQHGGKSWPYWFRKMGSLASLVALLLILVAVHEFLLLSSLLLFLILLF